MVVLTASSEVVEVVEDSPPVIITVEEAPTVIITVGESSLTVNYYCRSGVGSEGSRLEA